MNEIEQRDRASSPLEPYRGEYPGRRRRLLGMGVSVAALLVVLVLGAFWIVHLNDKVRGLENRTAGQSAQIHHLQAELAAQHASVAAAVACLQTSGATEGLCSQLVK